MDIKRGTGRKINYKDIGSSKSQKSADDINSKEGVNSSNILNQKQFNQIPNKEVSVPNKSYSYDDYERQSKGWFKMNIKKKILLGFLIIILIIGASGFYILIKLNEISDVTKVVDGSVDFQKALLDFNVENFHTQLEVWEYAYLPNKERFDAFNLHNDKLTELLDEVEIISKSSVSAHEEQDKEIKEIFENLKMVRDDWVLLFDAISELREAKDKGINEDDEEFEILENKVQVLLVANEELFDELDFNERIDHIILEQNREVEKLEEHLENLESFIQKLVIIILIVIIFVSILIAFYLSNRISKPIIYLKDMSEEIGKGNLDLNIYLKTGDELEDLARSFNQMAKDLKANKVEIEKSNKQLVASNEELQTQSEELKSSNEEIESTNEELKQTTEELEKAKKELEGHKVELEKKVNERTKELATKNEELQTQSEELKSSNEEIESTNEELKKMTEELQKSKKDIEISKKGLEKQVRDRTKDLETAKAGLEKQVTERTAELQTKVEQLEKFTGAATDRELKMVELKKKIKELEERLNSKESEAKDG